MASLSFARALISNSLRQYSLRMMSTAGEKKLTGKVAIVTASTDGIGFAIARRLGQDGAKVMVSSRKQKNVDEAVKKLKAENLDVTGTVCHVGKGDDRKNLIDKTVSTYGGIDILVSNAGQNPFFGNILDCTEEQWDKIFDTNVKSTFLLVKETVPHIQARGGGSIIIVSSITGYNPSKVLGPYSVSKTALLGLTKALVHQLTPLNIRVNGIAPGIIKTRFSEALWVSDGAREMTEAMVPMKRLGEPHECAGIVSFLASDDASYVNGENILITGGIEARL